MIDLDDQETIDALRALRKVVLRLTVVSHVAAAGLGRVTPSSDEDIGGKCPGGGIDRFGDFQVDYRQKTAEHFQRRLWAMVDAAKLFSAPDIEALAVEAQQAVDAWTRTPDVSGVKDLEPERDSYLWKCAVADDDRDIETINRVWRQGGDPISRSTLYRYRAKYRGLRKSSVRGAA